MVEDLASSMPFMLGDIRQTGAGDTARWMRAQDIIDTCRGMFDPSSVAMMKRPAWAVRAWDCRECGPTYHDQGYDWYQHDSAISRSWHMTEPPRGRASCRRCWSRC